MSCSDPSMEAPSSDMTTSLICPEDPRLKKQVVAAALHLKEHGWAIVDDVLTRYITWPCCEPPASSTAALQCLQVAPWRPGSSSITCNTL